MNPTNAFADFPSAFNESGIWIWKEVNDKLSNKKLYIAPYLNTFRFRYGRLRKSVKALDGDDVKVRIYPQREGTKSPEWILEAALFSYALPENLNIDALFPKKTHNVASTVTTDENEA